MHKVLAIKQRCYNMIHYSRESQSVRNTPKTGSAHSDIDIPPATPLPAASWAGLARAPMPPARGPSPGPLLISPDVRPQAT